MVTRRLTGKDLNVITFDTEQNLYQDPLTKFVFTPIESKKISIVGYGVDQTIRELTEQEAQYALRMGWEYDLPLIKNALDE